MYKYAYLLFLAGCGSGGSPQVAHEVTPVPVVGGRQEVACPPQTPQTMVMLAFGQSNSANYMETKHSSDRVINYFDGKCFLAQDPLPGAGGQAGTLWTLLGDKLLATGKYDNVVVIAIGVSGTTVSEWQQSTWLEDGMKTSYQITHFLWYQGESDAFYKTPSDVYAASLQNLIDRSKTKFPASQFWVTIASFCGDTGPEPSVEDGQKAVIGPGVFQGPDTDIYGRAMRWDGCHLGAVAQEQVTDEWVRLLTQP